MIRIKCQKYNQSRCVFLFCNLKLQQMSFSKIIQFLIEMHLYVVIQNIYVLQSNVENQEKKQTNKQTIIASEALSDLALMGVEHILPHHSEQESGVDPDCQGPQLHYPSCLLNIKHPSILLPTEVTNLSKLHECMIDWGEGKCQIHLSIM